MDIIELLKVIFLGIVEGITEWLPISSTGHMILVDEFIHLNVSQDFMDVFLVVIQLGAILAVVVLYWNKLWPFYIKKLPRRTQMAIAKKPKWAQVILNFVERFCDKEKWVLWFKIVLIYALSETVFSTFHIYHMSVLPHSLPDPAGNNLHAVCSSIHYFHHKCAFSSSYLSIPLFFVLFFLRC